MAMTEEKDLEQEILEGNPDAEPAEDAGVEIPIESEEESEADEAAEDALESETEAEADTETESEEGAGKKKEGLFGKKKKKDKRDEQIEELNDKLKRQMAEFDNFRKRSEKEKSQMFDMGARTIIEKVLPVVDNFERGLAAVPEEQKEDAFVTGMDKVYKQLMTELDAIGVKAIEAVGQEFDPELHNAVMQVENEELESGTVAQELQKGYTYKETVVRHSMVAVVS
jgi:molecular chaperone GrpE